MLRHGENSPSVVAAPVAATPGAIVVDIPPITGSAVVLGCAPPPRDPPVFPPEPSVHPFWQPFATRQCPGVEPQYLLIAKSAMLRRANTIDFRTLGSSVSGMDTYPN